VCIHPINPMGIHLLHCTHGNECTKTHDEIHDTFCHNPSLGLVTKARGCKVTGQERKPENERKCEGMNPHTLKGASTLGIRISVDFRCSKSDCKGQNSMDWKVLYTIRKLLKHKCLKWARMTHLDIWNTSYGQRKGWESNCQIGSLTFDH